MPVETWMSEAHTEAERKFDGIKARFRANQIEGPFQLKDTGYWYGTCGLCAATLLLTDLSNEQVHARVMRHVGWHRMAGR